MSHHPPHKSQIISNCGQEHQVELNGTFLVHPDRNLANSDLFTVFLDTRRFQSQEAEPPENNRLGMELVIDGTNLLPFHFLRTGDRMGRSVVKIQRNDGATGTGFLVAPDVVLTNHHVLPSIEIAASAVAMANYEVSPPNDPAGRPAVSVLDPASLFLTNADLDFTFCGVQGLGYLGSIPLDRERMHIASEETVTIIQHPRGRPKEIALRDNRVIRTDDVVVQYSCDTEPGSSGSPVFNNQWKPVAIHHASVMTNSPEGRRIAGNSKARYLNEGIRLSAIALWLETAEAESPQGREDVIRLRVLFGGLNQRVGFFGALGRHAYGRPASEVVADSSQNRPEMLDIGYWDTRTVAQHPNGMWDVLADMCRVIYEMGLDVWCFSALDAGAVETLCQQLWAIYGLNYQPVESTHSHPEVGPRVLLRPSTHISSEVYDTRIERPYMATRLRVHKRNRSEAEFRLVLMDDSTTDSVEKEGTARNVMHGLESFQKNCCGIILGTAEVLESFRQTLMDSDPDHTFAASDSKDGCLMILDHSGQTFSHSYLSPNLKPVFDLSRQFTIVNDRQLPNDLTTWDGPAPFAVRISLESRQNHPKPASNHLPPPPQLTREDASLGTLESQLRDLLIPAMTKIINDAVYGKQK